MLCERSCCVVMAKSNRVVLVMKFFFQAEDGIRDLVRSRGLGDVYKRQAHIESNMGVLKYKTKGAPFRLAYGQNQPVNGVKSVSYTHLTLPTSDLV